VAKERTAALGRHLGHGTQFVGQTPILGRQFTLAFAEGDDRERGGSESGGRVAGTSRPFRGRP